MIGHPKPPRREKKPRTPLPPSSHPIPRGKRPKATNAKRKAREFARTYHSKERVEFVKSLPCVICRVAPPRLPSHNAHTEGGGMGRKGDYTTIVPLCAVHHAAYDEHRAPFDHPAQRSFVAAWQKFTERQWQEFSGLASLGEAET